MRRAALLFMMAIFFILGLFPLHGFARASSVNAMTKTFARWSGQEKSDDLEEAKRLSFEAVKLYREGKHSEAIKLAMRALEIQERASGRDHLDVAVIVNNLAIIYQSKKDYKKAESFFLRALTIKEKALGPDHIDVARSLDNLATIYFLRKKYNKAEPLYLRALAIREKALGPDHDDLARTLDNLVELYYIKEEYEKAQPFYLRSIAIKEKGAEAREAVGKVDSRPIPLNRPRPNYTQKARANETQGIVLANVLVGIDGRVKSVKILRHLPDWLDFEAMRALFQVKFKPAMKDGQAVAFWQKVEIEFKLR
ncbi:MAG: TonB family protein [Blastocatellia bacterium]|nr:TonB family protein [Blastocatellia bacterium]